MQQPSATLTVAVRPEDAAAFEAGDVVKIATRAMVQIPSGPAPKSSGLLAVTAVHPATAANPDSAMIELQKITGSSAAEDETQLEAAGLNPQVDFPPGSVLLKPRRSGTDPNNPGTGATVSIIESKVAGWLASHGTLTADPANPAGPCVPTPAGGNMLETTSPTNLPQPWPELDAKGTPHYEVIGLYDGGNNWGCGVYRPTGGCLMRGVIYGIAKDPRTGGPVQMRAFCHVCRYAIVNAVDPAIHGLIDRDYPGP